MASVLHKEFAKIVVEENCSSSCLWIEFNILRPRETFFTISLPFGCLDSFSPEIIKENKGQNLLFEKGINIFSCETNLCNLPPINTSCTQSETEQYLETGNTSSPCYTTGSTFTNLRSNFLRKKNPMGLVRANHSLLNRCIDQPVASLNEIGFRKLYPRNLGENLPFVTCGECKSSTNCNVGEDIFLENPTFPQEPESIPETKEKSQVQIPVEFYFLGGFAGGSCFFFSFAVLFYLNKSRKEESNISQAETSAALPVVNNRLQTTARATTWICDTQDSGRLNNVLNSLDDHEVVQQSSNTSVMVLFHKKARTTKEEIEVEESWILGNEFYDSEPNFE
eukprot:snap_masked-scaffold_8-processed-gene-5.23-mRNA-1 protein AED:1.00 eAED:1.00 QI:0/0/0/0/1/1/2/0/336